MELDRWCNHAWDIDVTPVDAYPLVATMSAAEAYRNLRPGMIPDAIAVSERAAPHMLGRTA